MSAGVEELRSLRRADEHTAASTAALSNGTAKTAARWRASVARALRVSESAPTARQSCMSSWHAELRAVMASHLCRSGGRSGCRRAEESSFGPGAPAGRAPTPKRHSSCPPARNWGWRGWRCRSPRADVPPPTGQLGKLSAPARGTALADAGVVPEAPEAHMKGEVSLACAAGGAEVHAGNRCTVGEPTACCAPSRPWLPHAERPSWPGADWPTAVPQERRGTGEPGAAHAGNTCGSEAWKTLARHASFGAEKASSAAPTLPFTGAAFSSLLRRARGGRPQEDPPCTAQRPGVTAPTCDGCASTCLPAGSSGVPPWPRCTCRWTPPCGVGTRLGERSRSAPRGTGESMRAKSVPGSGVWERTEQLPDGNRGDIAVQPPNEAGTGGGSR
mmetsp:Transcript_92059/g.281771  ORF Transcript_92059/g.281771 Transcript_92059/m.281771 type:complete len:388 (-) Transcript_92059:982-2145(-)